MRQPLFKRRGCVKVIATGTWGRVEQWDQGSGRYAVALGSDSSLRQWFNESELVPVSSALYFLRLHSKKVFSCAAAMVAILPSKLWYRAVLRISLLQAIILRPLIALSPYRKDARRQIIASWFLNSWLQQLAQFRRPFAIPIRIKGSEVLTEASRHPNGMVICSVHLPLVHLILRSLVMMNHRPNAVVAGKTELTQETLQVWGIREYLQAIVPNGTVLLKIKRILCGGGSVFALVDTELGESFRPNIFRLIRTVNARAVFVIAELMPTGEILVEYFDPPDPFCLTDESIMSNLQTAQNRLVKVLRPSTDGRTDSAIMEILREPNRG